MDFCRLCFFDTPLNLCKNLFDNQPQDEPRILDIITTLTDIKVQEDDPYPKIICYNCHEKLINFYNFRQIVLQTHIKFHYIFNDQNNVCINNVEQENSAHIKTEKFDNENVDNHKQIGDGFRSVFIKEENEHKKLIRQEYAFDNSNSIVQNESYNMSKEEKNTSAKTDSVCNDADQNDVDEDEEKLALIKDETIEIEEHSPVLNKEHSKINADSIISNYSSMGRRRRPNRKKEKTFKCSNCNNFFHSELSLKIHTVQNRDKSYKCEICCKGFDYLQAYKKHKELHQSTNKETYPCHLCCQEFKTPLIRDRHLSLKHKKNNETNINDKNFQCTICDKRFTYNSGLNAHLFVHNSPEPFKCDQCTERFVSRTYLRRHLIDEHSNMERPYKCDVCHKKFVLQGSFKNHLNSHVNHCKPYKCDYCSRRFSYEYSLNLHLKLHTNTENLFKCKICNRKFTREAHLNNHLPVHIN